MNAQSDIRGAMSETSPKVESKQMCLVLVRDKRHVANAPDAPVSEEAHATMMRAVVKEMLSDHGVIHGGINE